MKKKSNRRKRDESDSEQVSSYEEDSPKRLEDLYAQLKASVQHNDKYIQKIIKNISKNYKQTIGILRITIPGSFSFNQSDMEEFFRKFGRIENVILKQHNLRVYEELPKTKEIQSISYIIFSEYFSAVLALKVVNSVSEKQRIINAKICYTDCAGTEQKLFSQPLINSYNVDDMILEIEKDYQFGEILNGFKYIGSIGLDLLDKNYSLKHRILGVKGSNFVRIYYMCEKSFRFENEGEQSRLEDLLLKLIINKSNDSQREVLVLSNSLQKYNQAIRYLHELMQQIVEEYKNSREKSFQIIPKDIHIKRWEKFSYQPHLKFLT